MYEQCQGAGHCLPELRAPGPSWEQSEEGRGGVTGALGQSVLGGQEPEKVNTVPRAIWLLLEPQTVKSWGNSDSGLSQGADVHSPPEVGRP